VQGDGRFGCRLDLLLPAAGEDGGVCYPLRTPYAADLGLPWLSPADMRMQRQGRAASDAGKDKEKAALSPAPGCGPGWS